VTDTSAARALHALSQSRGTEVTQTELAMLLGVNRVTAARWVTGATTPGPTAARLLNLIELHPRLAWRRLRAFNAAQEEKLEQLKEVASRAPRTAKHVARKARKRRR
jgi:transcriptional regulator with XRE-family HTH domain